MSKTKAQSQELVIEQGALLDPLQVIQPVSSSSYTHASSPYIYDKTQIMEPLANLGLDSREIGTMLYSAFVGMQQQQGCQQPWVRNGGALQPGFFPGPPMQDTIVELTFSNNFGCISSASLKGLVFESLIAFHVLCFFIEQLESIFLLFRL